MTKQSTPNSPDNSRVESTFTTEKQRSKNNSTSTTDWYSVAPLRPHEHIACTVAPPSKGLGIVNTAVEERSDPRQPAWSYDRAEDELVVSAQYENPLQYGVSIARALTCDLTWKNVLPPKRLGSEISNRRELGNIPYDILRNARCMGYLSDADRDTVSYAEALRDARDDLLGLTQQLGGVDGEAERQLRSRILRDAHGLIGTMSHLLDLFGIDVTRELRLPYYSRDIHSDGHSNQRRTGLLRFLMTALPINSRYGHYTGQRVLFEEREEKRASLAGVPTTSTEDPIGELLGQWTIVGRGVDKLVPYLETALRNPGELQIDCENFTRFRVDFRIESDWTRGKSTEAVHRMSNKRNRTVTEQMTRVLSSFLSSVYDICDCLSSLPRAQDNRVPLTVEECKYALSTLSPNRILPNATPTQSTLVHTLLGSNGPLKQKELASRAGVSSQSIRNNRDPLLLFDIVIREKGQYRINLGQAASANPWYVTQDVDLHDVLWDVAEELLVDEGRLLDLNDSLGAAFYWPKLITPIIEEWPWISPFVRFVGVHTREEFFARTLDGGQMGVPIATLTGFGELPMQSSLQTFVRANKG